MTTAVTTKPVMTVLRRVEFDVAGTGRAGDLRGALDTIGKMEDALAFAIRWHDQLMPADVGRLKAVLAEFRGEAE